jgi:hypothetical protein
MIRNANTGVGLLVARLLAANNSPTLTSGMRSSSHIQNKGNHRYLVESLTWAVFETLNNYYSWQTPLPIYAAIL